MKLIEAIESRKSIRAYKKMPVSKDNLETVIRASLRSPSATNLQPWELYVITGDVLEKIKLENVERFLSGGKPTFEEPPLNDLFRSRRSQLAKDLFALLGIEREDKEKRREWAAQGHGYFDAPTALIIALDQSVLPGTWALMGIGSFVQTFCLAALEYGLGTCISEQGVAYHDIIRKYVDIPDSKRIVISITVGYPDWNAPQNQLVSTRVSLEEVVHWIGK